MNYLGYANAGGGGGPLFVITSLESPSNQPTVIDEGNQTKGIGASFYMRAGRTATIDLTWSRTEAAATEEFTKWFFNDVEINFNGGRIETITNNGNTILRQYSVSYPDIYVMTEVGVLRSQQLVIPNVSKEKSEGKYRGEVRIFR